MTYYYFKQRILLACVAGFLGVTTLFAQKTVKKINKKVDQATIQKDMMYLASDQLQGRKTGEAGNHLAAAYIAAEFRKAGVRVIPGMKDYFQSIPFQKFIPPKQGEVMVLGSDFTLGSNLVILYGGPANTKTEAVYADYGWIDESAGRDDYKGLDVKGRIVLVQGGLPQGGSPTEIFASMAKKREMARSRGAVGLLEIYNLSFPWNFFRSYFSRERLEVVPSPSTENDSFFHAWLQLPSGAKPSLEIGKSFPMQINTSGALSSPVQADNVLGYIPGKKRKDEYVMLSAHFDHVGTRAGQVIDNDTIWNGARDNAWGTVGLIAAARYFAQNPPDRSILLAAVNGEEMGLLGSKYLADHPVLPWKQVIFNLNSDGAGYSDTTIVSVIGLNRVGAAAEINAGCEAFGLATFADPAPEQGLFDRSDNASFAALGIPAPTIAAGLRSFDETVRKYYHQSIDNPDNISYSYLTRFTKAFVNSANNIANMKEKPKWQSGDKYEAAAKKLYGY